MLLNDGDGTFAPLVGHVAGERPTALVAADTDGDGDLDLAVSNQTSDDVVVLVNDAIVATPSATPSPAESRALSVSPTPFNPSLAVHLQLPDATPVIVEILSVSGRRVRLLAERRPHGPGVHRLIWDGRSERGASMAPGVYYVRLTTRRGVETERAVLVR